MLSLLAPSTYEAQTSFWESRPRSLYLNRMPARPECTDFSAFPVCSDITLNVQDESGSSVTEVCPGKNYKVKVRVSSKNYKVKVRVSSVTEVCPGKNYRVKVWVSSKNYKVKVRVNATRSTADKHLFLFHFCCVLRYKCHALCCFHLAVHTTCHAPARILSSVLFCAEVHALCCFSHCCADNLPRTCKNSLFSFVCF